MEYRKLISFGKNSYVVSLPKDWVKQNQLQKGDLVYIDETGANLILSKKDQNSSLEEKETVINVDGKSVDTITREVCSAYILNFRSITLKGKDIKNQIKDFQSIVQNLIALEIMEQTANSLTAKDFLNMDKVSTDELIRKMDVVTRTMLMEMCNSLDEKNHEAINERDKDVNRLFFLLYRAVVFNLEHPMKAMKNFKMRPIDFLRIHKLSFYIEGIADEAKRAARYTYRLKMSEEKKKQMEQLFRKVTDYYIETMKTVYKQDPEAALKLSDLKQEYDDALDAFEKDILKVEHLNQIVNKMRSMINYIHRLGKVVYTLI
ncbi:AbrB/MazE/SpoVT family DNA-binding domain-containing protein [Candidatus Woesearchaeota archaeon]|nr:AbrB/MazE/SpoVT family DNA-binding domain-containing protein [Candidatus Woesearchaeota archaeon]